MGTNNKKKTIKDIKGLDKAHPYSRKAVQMKRAIHRGEQLESKQKIRNLPKQLAVEKLEWFQTNCAEKVSMDELQLLILAYINRHQNEIDELAEKQRKDRPKHPRLVMLHSLKEKELHDFTKIGFDVPDLRDEMVFEQLKNWKSDYNSISQIKHVRIKKDQEDDEDMQEGHEQE